MQSGKLRHLFTVETPTITKDSSGRISNAWATFATVYGAIQPSSSKYQTNAEAPALISSHYITIRKLTGLNKKMRFKLGTRIFDIVSVKDDETLQRDHIVNVAEVVT